jgi:hypothetical protein
VIVVTGPGRSGTSLLARLYRELGFDPGGWFQSEVRAGLEHRDVWALNVKVARALGVSAGERRGGRLLESAGYLVRRSDGHVPPGIRRPFVHAVDRLRYLRSCPDLMDFDRIEGVSERFGDQMRALAKELPVAKDPQFSFTLGAWLKAGAPVESLVFTIRSLDSMTESRVRAGMFSERARSWARHNYAYGIGLLLAAAAEHRLPVVTLRYPDFTEDPRRLYEVLPLPQARSWEEFSSAFDSVFDPALVQDRS